MLAVSVEFLHGTFRSDPDGTANTGRLTRGEWPPAPFRLFAALVAADGTRERCTVTDGAELEWFEQLPPPVTHAHAQPCHQRLTPRYVVRHAGTASKSTHQEYVGRAGVLRRPGVRVTPRHPHVVYSWNESPPEVTLDALRRRAARIGYLGATDSPVRVHVMTRMPEVAALEDAFVHALDGNMMINVPAPGDVRMLDRMYDAWYEHGADLGRAQFPALRHEARTVPRGPLLNLTVAGSWHGCVSARRFPGAGSRRSRHCSRTRSSVSTRRFTVIRRRSCTATGLV